MLQLATKASVKAIMPHKRKRKTKQDHDVVNLEWTKIKKRLRRKHSAAYVQQEWEHLLVLHPGGNAKERRQYAAQVDAVPKHRDDIQWLQQDVTCGWERVKPTAGCLTEFAVDGSVLTVASGALQKAGIDTHRRKGQLMKAGSSVATNMALKNKRKIPAFGTIPQLGLRYRKEEPADSDRPKLAVSAKSKKLGDRQFSSMLNDIRNLSCTVVQVTNHWMANVVREREATLQSVVSDLGSISTSYPAVQVGINVGVGIHLDSDDLFWGTWACLGGLTMALPEYGVLLELSDGDIVTFDTAQIYHCMVRRPPEMCECACLSLYYNSKQHKRFIDTFEQGLSIEIEED